MKRSLLILVVFALVAASCGGVKKKSKTGSTPAAVVTQPVVAETVKEEVKVPVVIPEPIKEVEEKIVPVNNKPVDPSRYFVIAGSFRSADNARKRQAELLTEGFRTSELMRNEAGLYRVSVMATDDVVQARTEIMRIRSGFKKYNDAWLLISKK